MLQASHAEPKVITQRPSGHSDGLQPGSDAGTGLHQLGGVEEAQTTAYSTIDSPWILH